MFSSRYFKYGLMFLSLLFFLAYVLELDADARVGGGRSFGSRGSRSFSAPKSPSAAPSSPSHQATPTPSSPTMSPKSGGFMRSLAGGLIGGMIGGMLFRSLGFGGDWGAGGIGFFDIILIGLILYGIWWYIGKRRREATAPAGAAYFRDATAVGQQTSLDKPLFGQQAQGSDIDTGLGHIRQMDPHFDEERFKDQCMDNFFMIQGAWANRDLSAVRNLLTDEMSRIIQNDADELIKNRRINRLENIAVRVVEPIEAWQEAGNDFITVRFYANLLDYTIDETTGKVVSGSKTDPVKFEEFWTFTRPVGNNPWQLSSINQLS